MRVSSSMYYDNLYKNSHNDLSNKLFDVNKQISSGLNIQYAKDDIRTFTDTMRLDNEVVILGQIKKSTENGFKVSSQSDTILNSFSSSMTEMKTLLINAANDSNDDISRDAIAKDLRGLESHFKNLANTSINGKYIFSGSAVDTKPIADDGTYMGNDFKMNSILGTNVRQQYNMSGSELFLGEESQVQRQVTSNVVQKNLGKMYPDYTDDSIDGIDRNLTTEDTIRDLMGDSDNEVDEGTLKHHFYIRGTKSDGESFNKQIKMSDDQSVENLLTEIGKAYGNTPDFDLVNVTMNSHGQILIEDKFEGSSKLEFHMVGATDLDRNDNGGRDDADITLQNNKITDLDGGETDFGKIMRGTSTANNSNLHIKEFMVSPFNSTADASTNIKALDYDRTEFTKNGAKLTSNVTQVLKSDNSFITPSTKIADVANISKGTADTADDTLDGNSLRLVGTNTSGGNYDIQIDFKSDANGGSTFSLDTDGDGNYDNGTYDIYNMKDPRTAVDADEMTYQQLMDVINMSVTNNLPAGATDADYDKAIKDSNDHGGTHITYDGKIEFEDRRGGNTKASIALHDVNSGDFSKDAPIMTFNSNNALEVRDAKTDFFKTIDRAIKAVEEHKLYPDSKEGDSRNIGIQNAIEMITKLEDHINSVHTTIGANSNILQTSLERTETLELSTKTLRSSVIDVDLAEASLNLTQLSLSYEAMLSTVGKVSKLSLVNYL